MFSIVCIQSCQLKYALSINLISWFIHVHALLVIATSLVRKYIRLIVSQSVSQVEKNSIYVYHRSIHSSFRSSYSLAFVASNSLSPTLPFHPPSLPSFLDCCTLLYSHTALSAALKVINSFSNQHKLASRDSEEEKMLLFGFRTPHDFSVRGLG